MSKEPRSVGEALAAEQEEPVDTELGAEGENGEIPEAEEQPRSDRDEVPGQPPASTIAELRDALVGQEPEVEAVQEEPPPSSPDWNGRPELSPEPEPALTEQREPTRAVALAAPGSSCARIDAARTALAAYPAILNTGIEP